MINPVKPTTAKRVFFDNLDGLRFLAFLSVFLYHSFYTDSVALRQSGLHSFLKHSLFTNGNLGVNFFFVLSGFLITYLLIEERLGEGKIHIVNFWIRRILRIWPLFYVVVLFGFYGFPLFKSLFGQAPDETANIACYLTFTNNFDVIRKGLPDASVLGVLWSIAIEEQFYLVWPVILSLFPVKKYWIPFLSVIAMSLIFRALTDSATLNEMHTLSCIGDMATGAMGAWLIHKPKFQSAIENTKKYQIIIVYVVFAAIFLFRKEMFFGCYFLRVVERLLIAIIICFIILEQNFAKNSFFKIKNFRHISKLGIITYGLYSLHFIGILITLTLMRLLNMPQNLFNVVVVETIVSFALTVIIAKISYKCFEKPFLKLKNKFTFVKTR